MKHLSVYFLGLFLLLFSACNTSHKYSINGTVEDGPDTVVVLNNWYTSSDTIHIRNGEFTFRGEIDTFPKLVSLRFPLPGHERTNLILEPGKIEISYSSTDGFAYGGTQNNDLLHALELEIEPFSDKVSESWKNWVEAYNREKRIKKVCEDTYDMYEDAKRMHLAKVRELVRQNPNYPGLVISLPILRYETADNLKSYTQEFKEFSYDRRYKSLNEYYKAAERSISGRQVPDFSLPDTKGKILSLADFRGKWLLLDFWYSGCHWCRKMTPHLESIYADLQEEGRFEIISISVDKPEDRDKWLQAIEEDGIPWVQVWDSSKTIPDEYGVIGYPTLFIVDPEGRGREKIIGYHEERSLRRIIEGYVR